MKKLSITALQLRIILSVSMFVIIAIAVVIASLSYHDLKRVAIDVSRTTVDSDASQNNIQTLQKIQAKLATDKDVVDRTNSIVADSQSYQYQDQIINDLKDYAAKAGVAITNIDFSSATATTPATPQTPTAPPVNGVKSTSVSVTLKNPIDYNTLLVFLNSIEQNLTKMQISKITLSKGESGRDVSSEALAIEVYIR